MSDESGWTWSRVGHALNLFARENFVITTYLDDVEIHRRLEEVVAPYSLGTYWFKFFNPKPYIGRISADGFWAERISLWMDTPPRATARFLNDGRHTLIEMSIAQRWQTILAAAMIALVAIAVPIQMLTGRMTTSSPLENVAFFLLVLVILAALVVPYTREMKRTKQYFRELLEDIEMQD